MKSPLPYAAAFSFLVLLSSAGAQKPQLNPPAKAADVSHSDRIKRADTGGAPLLPPQYAGGNVQAWGIWVPEPDDAAHALEFPEQVRIICIQGQSFCTEITVFLGSLNGLVTVNGPGEVKWEVKSWDKSGILASRPADPHGITLSDRCYSHVLSIAFASGAISTSDIPVGGKECKALNVTNSYRLTSGYYYVDTSPKNDRNNPFDF